MNTKLQLLVRRSKLKFACVLFLKSFYRTTVIDNDSFLMIYFPPFYFVILIAISYNGPQLPEGGDFEALHFQLSRNCDRSTKLDLTTEPPLLSRCCYSP